MKQKKLGILLCLVLVLALTGCGKKKTKIESEETDYIGNLTENTLTLHPDGTLDQVICEELKDTDVAAGAEEYVKGEIDAYNAKMGVNKISLLQYSAEGTKGKAAIRYSDMESYRSFNLINVELQDFDKDKADALTQQMQPPTEEQDFSDDDLASVSDAELIEAGIDPEEFRSGKYKEEKESEEPEVVTATFTDASGTLVKSADVPADRMMLFIDEETTLVFDTGVVYYTNGHGTIQGSNKVKTDGKGTCIVIFVFNY